MKLMVFVMPTIVLKVSRSAFLTLSISLSLTLSISLSLTLSISLSLIFGFFGAVGSYRNIANKECVVCWSLTAPICLPGAYLSSEVTPGMCCDFANPNPDGSAKRTCDLTPSTSTLANPKCKTCDRCTNTSFLSSSLEQHCDPTDIFYTTKNRKGSCEQCTTCANAIKARNPWGSPSTSMITQYSDPSKYNDNQRILYDDEMNVDVAKRVCKYAYDSRLNPLGNSSIHSYFYFIFFIL